ncbi:hypothetical protein [Cryobacterium sp. M91]|nr:hypothetical protein [Cryobacterium sp. M91]
MIRSGEGSAAGKHVATYQLATETCSAAPGGQVAEIVALALKLVV